MRGSRLDDEVTSQTQAVQSTAVETVAWRRLSAAERGASRIRAVRETLEIYEGACAAAFIPVSHNADAASAPADYANVDAAAAAAAQTRIALLQSSGSAAGNPLACVELQTDVSISYASLASGGGGAGISRRDSGRGGAANEPNPLHFVAFIPVHPPLRISPTSTRRAGLRRGRNVTKVIIKTVRV
jgi:hypothetical protein